GALEPPAREGRPPPPPPDRVGPDPRGLARAQAEPARKGAGERPRRPRPRRVGAGARAALCPRARRLSLAGARFRAPLARRGAAGARPLHELLPGARMAPLPRDAGARDPHRDAGPLLRQPHEPRLAAARRVRALLRLAGSDGRRADPAL